MCSVHREMFSTSGGIQYIGEYTVGYHEYIEGCLVHRRDIMMHVGGYYDACGDTKSTSGDVGRYHEYSRGYHEHIGGCSVHWQDIMMHVGEQVDKIL